MSRGSAWTHGLAGDGEVREIVPSVLRADIQIGDSTATLLTVVPDPASPYPRARAGEVGLRESLVLAEQVTEIRTSDTRDRTAKRPIIAIVDVQSQAYGRLESLLGIHLSLAAAADAYATARMAGHPVVALIVGTALSGGLLGHGDQAHRLLALDDPKVIIQAMRKQSAARVTRRTVEELDELGKTIIPMAYDIRQFAKLGLLHELITGIDADAPSAVQIERVKERVAAAIADIRKHPGDLTSRLNNPEARAHRAASIEVRRRLTEQWNA